MAESSPHEDPDVPGRSASALPGPLAPLSGVLSAVAGDSDRIAPIADVAVYEPRRCDRLPARSFVLGVGLDDVATIVAALEVLSGHDVAALAVREVEQDVEPLHQAARRAEIPVLTASDDISWDALGALVRSVIKEGDQLVAVGGIAAGDLDAVANAVASLVDAPITIEDVNGVVLAFSQHGGETDDIRTDTILGRRVSRDYLVADQSRGVFATIQRSRRPVFVESLRREGQPVTLPRMAIAVRAGQELVGYIWAVVREPMDAAREQALTDAAGLVAVHMLRQRIRVDLRRQLLEDLVTDVLAGAPSSAYAAHRLGLERTAATVIAATARRAQQANGGGDDGAPDDDTDATELIRRQDTLAQDLAIAHPGSVVAQQDGVLYGIIPTAPGKQDAADRIVTWCRDFVERRSTRESWTIGIGRTVTDMSRLRQSRDDATRALRTLRASGPGPSVTTLAAVYTRSLLIDLADQINERNEGIGAPLAALFDYDQDHGTDLVRSLESWLDALGMIPEAARIVNIHPNTFRYRLQRIAEISGLDLDSPDDRFAVTLQLRLLRAGLRRDRPE